MHSRPPRIADSVPGDEHDPNIRWSENVKLVLTRSGFQNPDEFVSGVFRIVWTVISAVEWNLKVDILRDFVCFITFQDPTDISTLRVWNVPISEMALRLEVNLDNRPPDLTGRKALQFIVDEFVDLPI